MYERYDDDQYFNVIKNHVTGEILDDAGEIADLLQDYLVKKTKLEFELNHFKDELRDAIKNEHMTMGRNALKQLADRLGVDY